ncbi:MAG: HD domain-containing phosphohydrolase [Gemmatimonadota bacterium]|nr:HD domain-containing phosphohydrolase [Gemmatimonadota bacterium]
MTTTPLLFAPAGRALAPFPALGSDPGLAVQRVDALPAPDALDDDTPVVVLLDAAWAADRTGVEALAARVAFLGVGAPGAEEPDADWPVDALCAFVPADASTGRARTALQSAVRHAATLVAARRAAAAAAARAGEITEVTRFGVALSTDRDLPTLLAMILEQARRLSSADAGSLYLVERQPGAEPALRFKLSQNQTLPDLPFSEFTIPLNASSIAGAAAVSGEAITFDDAYALGPGDRFSFNRSFDEKFGYRTKSMVTIPMRTHRDEIVGVLQLINRKRSGAARLATAADVAREVVPFDAHAVALVSALASQAAVAIENGRLYEDIEKLFEGFVMASVTAIESRDPTTSGHSSRVATFTTGLAAAIDRVDSGPYGALRFSREEVRELRYASLLHDFGKVGVREQVLVKQKKLYPSDLSIIRHRFQFLLQRADLQYERERAQYLWEHGRTNYEEALHRLDRSRAESRDQLQRFLDAIVRANEPTILPEGTFEELSEINERLFVDFDGTEKPLLSDDELRYLMINRGNLDERERREIESHVTHTYRFLEQIPWTRELKGIPGIAWGHHEKLDGSGYPRGVRADDIPVQTRMMTISDIYDALTATDRPYKRAVPAERALDILHDEAKHGHVDPALLAAFVEARVFEAAHPTVGRTSGANRRLTPSG